MALVDIDLNSLRNALTDARAAKVVVVAARALTTPASTEETWCTTCANSLDTAIGLMAALVAAIEKANFNAQITALNAQVAARDTIIAAAP